VSQGPEALYPALACPYCLSPLQRDPRGVRCATCPQSYGLTPHGALDLRLRREKIQRVDFHIEPRTAVTPEDVAAVMTPLAAHPRPEVDFASVPRVRGLPRALMSHFPRAPQTGALALDLGCGKLLHRPVCEHAGFVYVGLDYTSDHATVLGDAHALPFADNSFDFVLSLGVFEHIRFPFVAVREAHRVLRPGRKFIGMVAFLEPYHWSSFYHQTHMGVWNLLRFGGFAVERISPDPSWPVLTAQATMALFPRMPKGLARAMVFPVHAAHRAWWSLFDRVRWLRAVRRRKDMPASLGLARQITTAGAFAFIASK